jgi:transporter family-2 protein
MSHHALLMFAAGLGIPVLAALNAALGRHVGAPFTAGVVLFTVALLAALAVSLLTGSGGWERLPSAPRHTFLAGLLVAFYVLSITWVAPRFGIGNAVFFVLIGQLVSAALIDRFGLFGAPIQALTPMRMAGLGLMAMGVVLTQRG